MFRLLDFTNQMLVIRVMDNSWPRGQSSARATAPGADEAKSWSLWNPKQANGVIIRLRRSSEG